MQLSQHTFELATHYQLIYFLQSYTLPEWTVDTF